MNLLINIYNFNNFQNTMKEECKMKNFKYIYEKCIEFHHNGREIIIYGAGLAGHLIYRSLKNKYGVEADYFCTSFEAEHIDRDTKLTVLNRDSLCYHKQALVIVALGITFSDKTYIEIERFILLAGVPKENIIINTHDWIISEAKPYIDGNGKLNIYTLSFHVTKQCNLKCKMCGQLLFGLVERRSFPSEQIIRDSDTIFRLVDYIEVMKLIGGELLTYAKLDELIDHLNLYKDKIGLLEIYTNGAIMPKESILNAIVQYEGNIQVTISDYGKLSVAKEAWLKFGKDFNIKINVMGFNLERENTGYKGWIDCTKIEDLNETEDSLEQKFESCGQRLDFVLEDSVLGKCTSFHMLNYALGRELDKNESIYINDEISDEEKKKRIVELGSDDQYLQVCRYCVWGSSIRDKLPRFPAAEQME